MYALTRLKHIVVAKMLMKPRSDFSLLGTLYVNTRVFSK